MKHSLIPSPLNSCNFAAPHHRLQSLALSQLRLASARSQKFQKFSWVGMILLLCFLVTTPAHTQSQPLPLKQEIIIGTTATLNTTHPLLAKTAADKLLLALIHRPITALNATLQPVCLLCDKLPTLENGLVKPAPTAENGNLISVTVRLPENAVWGDSTPLTSKDAYFTWQIAKKLIASSMAMPFYQQVSDIQIIDDTKFIILVNNAAYAQHFLHDFYILSQHVENTATENQTTYLEATRYKTTPFDVGLFAGAYRLTAFNETEAVVVPNTAWWGAQKPVLQKITLRVFPHAEALQEALLKKQINVVLPPAGLNFDQAYDALKTSLNTKEFVVNLTPSTQLEHLVINLENPLLADARVRRALLHSIDREKFNDLVFQNKRFVADSFMPPQHPFASTTTANKEDAASLLAVAGFTKGADGILVNNQQQRLSFAFATVKDDPALTTLQQLIANAWAQIGVETTLESYPLRDLEQRILPQKLFTGVALIRSTFPDTQPPIALFSSTAKPHAANKYQGQNYSGWQNEKVDSILAALATSTDTAAAQQRWQALNAVYLAELPTLPLYFTPAITVLPKDLQGVPLTTGHTPQTFNAETWFFTPPVVVQPKKEREIF
jgi:peptide/nickel transport system substrate-binding protein